VLEAVRALGFTPSEDNEADALAIPSWAMTETVAGSSHELARLTPPRESSATRGAYRSLKPQLAQ